MKDEVKSNNRINVCIFDTVHKFTCERRLFLSLSVCLVPVTLSITFDIA